MAQTLDQQIMEYLPLLGADEKKSILSVIKSFVQLHKKQEGYTNMEEYNNELHEAELQYKSGAHITHSEIERRFKELESGKVKGVTLDEMELRARTSRKNH